MGLTLLQIKLTSLVLRHIDRENGMLNKIKGWIKTSDNIIAKTVFTVFVFTRHFSFPVIPLLHNSLYKFHKLLIIIITSLLRVFYWTPLFKSQLFASPRTLYLYSGMPLITGSLKITIGEGCRISGISTFSGRFNIDGAVPELYLGNNVDISWQNNIAVGTKIVIEDNVRLAGKVFLAGYPGHPLDPERRANGEQDDPMQIGDIVLEKDVWLATGTTVMAGVTIGTGTIVAANSVVTKNLPPMVLAAGIPAVVVKRL